MVPIQPLPSVRPAAMSLLPKRTTVVRKNKRQRQQQSENAHPQQIPPITHQPDLENDDVIGEVDRPLPPLDKPEGPTHQAENGY